MAESDDATDRKEPEQPPEMHWVIPGLGMALGLGAVLAGLCGAPTSLRGVVAIAAASILGAVASECLTRRLVPWLGLEWDPAESFRASFLVALAEGVLYPTALLAGQEGLAAVWLGFKAVSVWSGHASAGDTGDQLQARRRYNLYLFNNALRLGLGVLAWMLAERVRGL